MENIIVIILLITTILLLRIIFGANIKKIRELEYNKELQKITNKFPENITIAKEILKDLENENVDIKETKGTNTSLYIAVTNKIIIADMKENYGRIQTIAHECAHSIQNRKILMFNFIFSNMYILYFLIILTLTLFDVINNIILQIFIFTLFSMIKLIVRTYLESEAMTKSKFIAERYIEKKEICTKEEQKSLLKEYEKINKIGIPFMLYSLTASQLMPIIIYAIIGLII